MIILAPVTTLKSSQEPGTRLALPALFVTILGVTGAVGTLP